MKITFSTNLNESISVEISEISWKSAYKKILKEFPSAHNFR